MPEHTEQIKHEEPTLPHLYVLSLTEDELAVLSGMILMASAKLDQMVMGKMVVAMLPEANRTFHEKADLLVRSILKDEGVEGYATPL